MIPKELQEDEQAPVPSPEELLGQATESQEPPVDLLEQGNADIRQGTGIQKNLSEGSTVSDLTDALSQQAKIASAGLSGAAQSHDRKYDNPALQKIFEDIQAKRAGEQANRQKTSESLVSRGIALKKEPGEMEKQGLAIRSLKSKLKVDEGTEDAQIKEARNKANQGELFNQELTQRIQFAADKHPDELRNLKARTQMELTQAKRLAKMDRTLSPTLAEQYAKTLEIPLEKAQQLTYEDADLLMKGKQTEQGKNERFTEAQVTKYGQSLKEQGIPEMEDSLQNAEAILKKYEGEDLPGVGATGILPDIMVSKDGKDFRQELAKVTNSILFGRGGKNLTKTEKDAIEKELGTGSAWSDDNIRRGMVLVRKAFDKVKQNTNASYDPKIVNEYINRGGQDFRAKLTFPKTVSNGTHEAVVNSEEELKAATAKGFH